MNFRLIHIELYKVFSRPRTYIGFAGIALLVLILEVAFYIDGNRLVDFATQSLKESFIFTGNLMNGYLVCLIVLQTLIVHVPLLVSLVAGELLAGEASAGTFRFLLTRPISRMNVVVAKYIAAMIYTIALVIWLSIVGLGLGVLLFGHGELIVMKTASITIFAENDVLWRFAAAFAFGALGMSTVAALALLLSSITENAVGPIVGTMLIIIIFLVINATDVEILNKIKPFLFTTHINAWKYFFEEEIDVAGLWQSGLILFAHILAFVGMTTLVFKRKDILS